MITKLINIADPIAKAFCGDGVGLVSAKKVNWNINKKSGVNECMSDKSVLGMFFIAVIISIVIVPVVVAWANRQNIQKGPFGRTKLWNMPVHIMDKTVLNDAMYIATTWLSSVLNIRLAIVILNELNAPAAKEYT